MQHPVSHLSKDSSLHFVARGLQFYRLEIRGQLGGLSWEEQFVENHVFMVFFLHVRT